MRLICKKKTLTTNSLNFDYVVDLKTGDERKQVDSFNHQPPRLPAVLFRQCTQWFVALSAVLAFVISQKVSKLLLRSSLKFDCSRILQFPLNSLTRTCVMLLNCLPLRLLIGCLFMDIVHGRPQVTGVSSGIEFPISICTQCSITFLWGIGH